MSKPFVTLLSVFLGLALAVVPTLSLAGPCPEVDAAKAKMKTRQAYKNDDPQAPRGTQEKEIQAPRSLASAKAPEIQAPRSTQEKEIQAPRGTQEKEIQAPRSLASAKSKGTDMAAARRLISEAEAACKSGNTAMAAEKANAAMELLK